MEKEDGGKRKGMKIFWKIFFILLILAVIYIGYTAYQVYSLFTLFTSGSLHIQDNFEALMQGDCSKVDAVGSDINTIDVEILGACKNPLIAFVASKMNSLPFNCSSLKEVYVMMQGNYTSAKTYCENLN